MVHEPAKMTLSRSQFVAQLIAWADEYDRNPVWVESDQALEILFRMHPLNDDLPTVLLKVVALDSLYGTQFFRWQGWYYAAHHIISLSSSLDECLRLGSIDAIEMIRCVRAKDGRMRNLYVFATKYSHWHNPDAFPIYDSRVEHFLPRLARKIGMSVSPADLRENYRKLKVVIDACREAWVPDWSYKRFDKAIYVGAESSPDL